MISRREIQIEGEKLWMCGMTGVVAGEKKWSETRVQSSVGHSHLGPVASVSTSVNTRHEFWLVSPDGDERCVQFHHSSIVVREGQMMSAIWGASAKSETGPYLMLRNNNANSQNFLIDEARGLLRQMRASDPAPKWVAGGLISALFLIVLFHSLGGVLLALLVSLGGAAYGMQSRTRKAKAIKQAIIEAMNLEAASFEQRRAEFLREQQNPQLQAQEPKRKLA